MLVLTRSPREGIQIGEDITIAVERIGISRVTLKVIAPPELARRIESEGTSIPADQAGISLRPHDVLGIGSQIRVVVIQIAENRVRLGIESPREIPIRRVGPH